VGPRQAGPRRGTGAGRLSRGIDGFRPEPGRSCGRRPVESACRYGRAFRGRGVAESDPGSVGDPSGCGAAVRRSAASPAHGSGSPGAPTPRIAPCCPDCVPPPSFLRYGTARATPPADWSSECVGAVRLLAGMQGPAEDECLGGAFSLAASHPPRAWGCGPPRRPVPFSARASRTCVPRRPHRMTGGTGPRAPRPGTLRARARPRRAPPPSARSRARRPARSHARAQRR
jgi:hypothetical protein